MGFLKTTVEQPALQTKIKSDEVKIQEIVLGYFLAPFCAMLANSIFGAYLTRYYADVLGWTKFGAGAFAALLPIVSVVFVVLGNLIVGKWIDNTRTKAGKARPYLFASIPLMVVAIILMFTSPNNGSPAQMIWIAVSYNLYYSVAYPCYYTAHSSMVALSTRDTKKRGLLATMSNASMVAAAGVGASILVPILLQGYMFSYNGTSLDVAKSYSHWRLLSIVFALVSAVGILLEYFFTRERITEERRATGIFAEGSILFNSIISNINAYGKPLLSNRKMDKDTGWVIDSMHVKTPSKRTHIKSLSGGNQQKVIIGRWLLTQPDVLLLDEPTRGIDVGAKYEIYQLILNLAEQGKGVMMVSSEMPELLGICDRILVMSNGRLAGIVERGKDFGDIPGEQETIMALAAKYV